MACSTVLMSILRQKFMLTGDFQTEMEREEFSEDELQCQSETDTALLPCNQNHLPKFLQPLKVEAPTETKHSND